ncbi:MAG: ribose 5-phosphate isomerase B [Bacteroidota bacterium]
MERGIVIAIGSDHAGYLLKETLKNIIKSYGFDYHDFGTFSDQSVDYPDYAIPLCQSIVKVDYKYGILICGTGNGMSMTANKFPEIRAALCWKPEIAVMARQHNDANVLVLPSRHLTDEEARLIFLSFVDTDFEGGRHIERLLKMSNSYQVEE